MLLKIIDTAFKILLIAVMAMAFVIGAWAIYDKLTAPRDATIECQGAEIMWGPHLKLDGDQIIALMDACRKRAEKGG